MSSQPSFESGSYDDTEIVTIYDDEGRSLDCYIENEIEYTNIIYVLLMPVDLAIIILKEQTKSTKILKKEKRLLSKIVKKLRRFSVMLKRC